MRFLRDVLRLTLLIVAISVVGRMVAIRLRRVLLLPTTDSTPPIGPGEVAAGMRRVIVSDLHLGAGDRLDDFNADEDLATFIRCYVMRGEPTELILAGDTFELLQVRLPDVGDYEWSGAAATRRLQAILSAHPEPIAALRDFVARAGNQLTLLIGNHDFELHYADAKRLLHQALGLDEADGRLRFGLTYTGGGIYVDHGMQFDPWNRFVHVEGISEPFEVVRGTRMVKEVINPLEDDPLPDAPVVDNVKPISAFFWYMLAVPRLRQPDVRRFVVRGLLLLFRTNALPHMYGRRPIVSQGGAPFSDAGPDVAIGQGRRLPAALGQALTRWLQRKPSDAALTQIQQEAGRQLRREIREFKDRMIREIAWIAARPEQSENTLFVCGHSHAAQIVALNEQQTYVNTGTWTEIVLDIATRRREEQRFPFLEIRYSPASSAPEWRLLVWHGADLEPPAWLGEAELRTLNKEGKV
jgi:UDP-2,3-diacylglucosamine pyrophosphatase LpxH